jgi:uncharacterized protein (TIGR03000 family)
MSPVQSRFSGPTQPIGAQPRVKALVIFVAVALTGAAAASSFVRAQAGEKMEVIVITVRLPADATLLIDDHTMQAAGGVRIFQTPPVLMGSHYAYTLKATSQGKEVTRKIHLAHGVDNSFDLRAEFLEPAAGTVQSKHFTTSATQVAPVYFSTINWGAALRTVEQALETEPADGSRFPK